MRTRIGYLAVMAAALLALPGVAAAARTVPIEHLDYARPSLTVERGATVRWTDRDRYVTHTVTSRGAQRFRSSGLLRDGDVHRARFWHRGTYRYACRVHPYMQGRIVVR